MIVSLQLKALLINFIYGFVLFFLSYINYLFIKKEASILKILITLLFMFDYAIVYLVIFYKLTSGIFHIFYLFLFVLGYYIAYKIKTKKLLFKLYNKLKNKIPKK